jgi:uncharacterized membrane protein YeaQ/YmgE (transglycosylase-associated protein family)
MHTLLWILEGLAVGWVTGKIMRGEGRDLVMDTIMGGAGGAAGGFILGAVGQRFHDNLIYTSLAAILGAPILTVLSRFFSGRREYGSTD